MNNQTVVRLLWTTPEQTVPLSTVWFGWPRHDRQQALAADDREQFSERCFFSTWSNDQLCRKVQLASRTSSRPARSHKKKVEHCRSCRLTDKHTESGACTTFTATRWLPNRTHMCRSRKVLCGIRSICNSHNAPISHTPLIDCTLVCLAMQMGKFHGSCTN